MGIKFGDSSQNAVIIYYGIDEQQLSQIVSKGYTGTLFMQVASFKCKYMYVGQTGNINLHVYLATSIAVLVMLYSAAADTEADEDKLPFTKMVLKFAEKVCI